MRRRHPGSGRRALVRLVDCAPCPSSPATSSTWRAGACKCPTTSAASMWRMIRRFCSWRRWPPTCCWEPAETFGGGEKIPAARGAPASVSGRFRPGQSGTAGRAEAGCGHRLEHAGTTGPDSFARDGAGPARRDGRRRAVLALSRRVSFSRSAAASRGAAEELAQALERDAQKLAADLAQIPEAERSASLLRRFRRRACRANARASFAARSSNSLARATRWLRHAPTR